MPNRLLCLIALTLLSLPASLANASGGAPFVAPPGEAPPFGLPPGVPDFEPPVPAVGIDVGLPPSEIMVEVFHPLAVEFGMEELGEPVPMLSFSFEPGSGPPQVPAVFVPTGRPTLGVSAIAAPEPGPLALLCLTLLVGLGLRALRMD